MYSDQGLQVIIPVGFPHSDIFGSTPLPARQSFSQVARPSSPVDAKASTNSPYPLDQKFGLRYEYFIFRRYT